MYEVSSQKLEPQLLPPTLHKYLYLQSDHRAVIFFIFKFTILFGQFCFMVYIYIYIYKEKVNKYSKNIGLKTIFRNILQENDNFYISHKSVIKIFLIQFRVMLTNVLRVIINNQFQKSFDTIFMRNEKNYQNINCFFFFSYKNFL